MIGRNASLAHSGARWSVFPVGAKRCKSASNLGSDAILVTDQLAESVFVESIQQRSVPLGERLLPLQRCMP